MDLLLAAVLIAIVGSVCFFVGLRLRPEPGPLTVDEAVRQPPSPGSLAEADLASILRSALPANRFQLQYELNGGARRTVKADAVVRIGDTLLPIDSKYPLGGYEKIISAPAGSPLRRSAVSGFRGDVKRMIDQVAAKYIQPDQKTTDFAAMFIGAEPIYHQAVSDTAVRDHAAERRVVLVSPSTLGALLAVVTRADKAVTLESDTATVLGRIEAVRRDLAEGARMLDTLGKHLNSAERKHAETTALLNDLHMRVEQTLSPLERLDRN